MKITYEFDPLEDSEELEIFQQAKKMHSVLWEFSHNVKRRIEKFEGDKSDGYQAAMDDFFEMMREENLEI